MDDLSTLTAGEAIAAMQAGRLKAEEYATALLAQVSEKAALNAFIAQDPEAVLREARGADQRYAEGRATGALHGLPVIIKDNIDTAALPTTAGSAALRGNRPQRDARIVTRLLEAGAILFGKANMHELSLGITSNNATFGPVRNPYNPALIAGGSSGGSAAAVAARMVAAGVGTDTGGSIRIPSALCGVVGFRPTVGRYPGTGGKGSEFVPISHTHDTPGPIARTVADVALLDLIMAGVDDPATRLHALRRGIDPGKLRLGVARPNFFGKLDTELEPVIDRALRRLCDAGVTLVDVEIPWLATLIDKVFAPISVFETMIDLPLYLATHGHEVSLRELAAVAGSDVRKALQYVQTRPYTDLRYRRTLEIDRPKLTFALQRVFADVDALVFPTTPLPARPIGQDITVQLNGRRVPTLRTYCANQTAAANANLPALTLPAGLTSAGLPVGLEIDGPTGGDEHLLAIGCALERILGPLPPPGTRNR